MPTGVYIRTKKHKKICRQNGKKMVKHSVMVKKAISKSLEGNTRCVGRRPWNKDIKLSRKQKINMKGCWLGKKLPEETKRKMRKAQQKRVKEGKHHWWKIF